MRTTTPVAPNKFAGAVASAHRFCVIGASTGGTEAVREVLAEWSLPDVAVLIVQHIPAAFSGSFAERLDRSSPLFVRHAVDGQALQAGHAYVAPGGQHMRLRRAAGGYALQLDDEPAVNRHRPSVDVLFESAVPLARDCVAAVLLTGMGNDGAEGLARLRTAGVHTIAQDEATSVVWGMPGAAVRIDAAEAVLPLGAIAGHLHATVRPEKGSAASRSGATDRYSEARIP